MIRYLILVIGVYVLYRVLRRCFAPGRREERDVKGEVVDDLVQDAYCKIYVPRRDSVKRVIGGTPHFFCSEECAKRFELECKKR